ncbi:MAG TPA: glycosyltransferase family 2 protein [Crenotrichaceae bacterium]|nr:glycosyltransferase family 2 protein [Crenotrichaceae bacterium]
MNSQSEFKPCVVVPVYNHEMPLSGVINQLGKYRIPCLLIDDGSDQHCATVIEDIANREDWVSVITHEKNSGKGAAIKTGLHAARAAGYSHVLQVDADGQHNLADVPCFLAQATSHPHCIIIGQPLFDQSIPKIRYYSRYLTHIWVWINTLSFQLKDTMCGFRVYPVAILCDYLDHHDTGNHMEFDIEILVKLFREHVCIESLPTKVNYPEDGLSHFRLWEDNALISRMHARLFASLFISYIPRLFRNYLFARK